MRDGPPGVALETERPRGGLEKSSRAADTLCVRSLELLACGSVKNRALHGEPMNAQLRELGDGRPDVLGRHVSTRRARPARDTVNGGIPLAGTERLSAPD